MHEPLDARTLQERRRAHRQTRTRRRRLLLLGGAIVLVAAVAVAVASSGGGSTPAGGHGRAGSGHASSGDGGAGGKGTGADGSPRGGSGTASAAAGGHASGHPGDADVPVLMYHVIAPPAGGGAVPGTVRAAEPSSANRCTRSTAAGWHAVTLDQLAANWREGAQLGPGKPVVVSFDNGYHSQYSQALPVLKSLGWVGDENIQLTGLPPSRAGSAAAKSVACWPPAGSSIRRASTTPT